MSLITCYDPDGNPHQKEPVDAREACLHNGFTMAQPGGSEGGAVAEYVPTKQELLAARDDLLARKQALDAEGEQVRAQADANAAEAQRLAQEADLLVAQRAEFAAQQAAAAQLGGSPDIASMTKAQLQAALEAKSIKFPAAADKAELQALLADAPTE